MVDGDHLPFKITEKYYDIIDEEYQEDTKEYINNNQWYKCSYGVGWCQDWKRKDVNGKTIVCPEFKNFVLLPKGFIKNYLGREMTYDDDIIEYKTFNIEDIKPFGDL